jgi:hypothetical protein
VAIASTDGKLATWSVSSAATLAVTVDGATVDYPLSGNLQDVYWSPDGTKLLAVSNSSTAPSGFELTLITPSL